jgi:hypothetical protein
MVTCPECQKKMEFIAVCYYSNKLERKKLWKCKKCRYQPIIYITEKIREEK